MRLSICMCVEACACAHEVNNRKLVYINIIVNRSQFIFNGVCARDFTIHVNGTTPGSCDIFILLQQISPTFVIKQITYGSALNF